MLLEFLHALESGRMTADQLLLQCLRRIAEREPEVRAWVEVLPQPELSPGPLSGIPFGVKDIFETRGLATEYGSPLYEGRKGESEASVVSALRRLGGTLLGKTRTAAFASFDPPGTRNPRLPGHTPGGSSSGSAAAVADRMIPFALGTQTLGSVLRPASFCGICGFKPSHGSISLDGVLGFAPALDTVGLFTQTAADMAELWHRAFGPRPAGELQHTARLRLACDESARLAIDDAVAALRSEGVTIDDVEAPDGWEELIQAAHTINTYEGARSHRQRFEQFGERIGKRLASLVREGLAMPDTQYDAARSHVRSMKARVRDLFHEYPAVLTPAAPGPAPVGLASTGDPRFNAAWTALGVPAISIPLPSAPAPLGLQITAARDRDAWLLGVAVHAASLLPNPQAPRITKEI